MYRRQLVVVTLGFLLGLGGGCFEDSGGDEGDGCPGAPGCDCMSNDDCDGAIVCEGGICNADECLSYADCPADAPICTKGMCQACNPAGDACPGGTHCDAGMCVPD